MFFEEKIDRLKQKFSTDDFKVPFTEGTSILKSIERKFITTKDLAHDLNNLRQYIGFHTLKLTNKQRLPPFLKAGTQ